MNEAEEEEEKKPPDEHGQNEKNGWIKHRNYVINLSCGYPCYVCNCCSWKFKTTKNASATECDVWEFD